MRGAGAAARLLLGLLGAALLPTGCGGDRAPPPSLVLVSVDSLRADRLGVYGAERGTSPAIDALAAEGALFEQAVAPSSWTLPSHVTLLTGLSLPAHRVRKARDRIDPARRLLAEHLRRQGYRTAAFVSAPLLHRAYGFAEGFDVYRNVQGRSLDALPPTDEAHMASHRVESAPQVIDAALEWLAARPVEGGRPWFLFVHLWDVHYDYWPPEPYRSMFDPGYEGDLDPTGFIQNPAIEPGMPERDLEYLRALYDGEVRFADAQLARLFEAVRDREPRERIALALVSDHGDEFFEHGNKGHMKSLYEESVRVPFIVRDPGEVPAGARLGGVAGLADVAPTLLDLAGLPPLPEATGRSLAPALRGEAEALARPVLLTLNALAALRGPGWKVLVKRGSRYAVHHDLRSDPAEQEPRPARRVAPERLGALAERLEEAKRHAETLAWEGGGPVELDAATRRELEALGYVE